MIKLHEFEKENVLTELIDIDRCKMNLLIKILFSFASLTIKTLFDNYY